MWYTLIIEIYVYKSINIHLIEIIVRNENFCKEGHILYSFIQLISNSENSIVTFVYFSISLKYDNYIR